MTLAIVAFATLLSTLFGGLFALRLRDRLHLILGFSAGAVIAVAFFDLLPEALELGGVFYEFSTILAVTALGFFTYLAIDRFFLMHGHDNEEEHHHAHQRGIVGASSLSIHSFLDGIGIGLAFQVSPAVGIVVAAAVLTHDFSDGINTVSMIVKNGGSRRRAFYWLAIDALAPVVGILATLLFSISDAHLGLLLALFAGFFLYIGASDLVPESHHRHPTFWTTAMTVLGAVVLFVAIRAAGV
jgi:ZIP family zinc transporter